MNSFKDIAYQILKEAEKPLHSKEITKIALKRGWLKTAGKTPEATMNAQLVVDINTKKEKSRFVKTAPSTFGLNLEFKKKTRLKEETKTEKVYKISKDVSTKQKGDIAEARIAELITLYGDTTLSCYKPISDDEGIDLIVKEKGSLKTMYIQIKSRFGDNPDDIFTATTKASSVVDNYSMATIFCFFDTEEGDLWNYFWFVPSPDFIKKANKLMNEKMYGFVAGRRRNESNKWDQYLIDKRDLANAIIAQMKRI
ncbi:MAG: HTH domain-containing protein [Minisyncoccia bacterium]